MTNKNYRASTFPSRLSLTLILMQKLASKVVNLGRGFREGNNGVVSIGEYSCFWEVNWQEISKPHTAVLSPGPKLVPTQSVDSEETLHEVSRKTFSRGRDVTQCILRLQIPYPRAAIILSFLERYFFLVLLGV